MKNPFLICVAALILSLLTSCGGDEPPADPGSNYLDSLFHPTGYRQVMDSLKYKEALDREELIELRKFINVNRDSIPRSLTYRQVLERKKEIQKMKTAALGMKVETIWTKLDKKNFEVRFELKFTNQLDVGIQSFRGHIEWYDAGGNCWDRTPPFAVWQIMAPDQTSELLRLEYAYYRPTGNELNDPRLKARRDSIQMMADLSKKRTDSTFRFVLRDMVLENGYSPVAYCLLEEGKRQEVSSLKLPMPRSMPLLDWASKNEDWIKRLKADFSPYYLEITPVITGKVESTHGKSLIFDRVEKVRQFFIRQKKVPSGYIETAPADARLVLRQYIDFWLWPMEIRIYQGNPR